MTPTTSRPRPILVEEPDPEKQGLKHHRLLVGQVSQ